MPDARDYEIEPVAPVRAVRPVRPIVGPGEANGVLPVNPDALRQPSQKRPAGQSADAATAGHMQAAYAQFAVDPDTHQVIVKIRDVATDRVLTELPSQAVQALDKNLRDYAEFLARHRAMSQANAAKDQP